MSAIVGRPTPEVVPGAGDAPVVLHVCQAITGIAAARREGTPLDPAAPGGQLVRIAADAADRAAIRPWIVHCAVHRSATEFEHRAAAREERHDAALAQLLDERLAAAGEVTIVDVDSFPLHAPPGLRDGEAPRPEVCVGTDGFHTSSRLRNAAVGAMRPVTPTGDVGLDAPLQGCSIPAPHHGVRTDVAGILLAFRGDVVDRHTDRLAAGTADLLDAIAPR